MHPADARRSKLSVFEIGGKDSLGLFGKLEFVEGAADFGFVAAIGVVFEVDTDDLAVGGQRLEGVTPALCFSQPLAQFDFVGNGNASLFQGIQKLLEGFVAQTAHLFLRIQVR